MVPKLIYNATKKGTIIMVKKSPNMLERKRMIIVENKIILSDIKENNIIEFNVEDIYKVIKLKNSLYIFKDKIKVFAIIPLDAFENELDKDKYLTLLKNFKINK